MRPARALVAVLTALALFLAAGGAATASGHHAKPIKPKLGIWEAAPSGVSSWTVGGWTLSRKNGHLHMTADPDFGGIFVPDANKCQSTYQAQLSKPDYRLGKDSFKIKDHEATSTLHGKPLMRHIVWTGTYFKKKQVKGKISIWLTTAPSARSNAKPKVVCRDMHRQWGGGTA